MSSNFGNPERAVERGEGTASGPAGPSLLPPAALPLLARWGPLNVLGAIKQKLATTVTMTMTKMVMILMMTPVSVIKLPISLMLVRWNPGCFLQRPFALVH